MFRPPIRIAVTAAAVVVLLSSSRGQATELAKLTDSSGALFDSFGTAVALSDDVALVGAPGTSVQTGSVFVFERQASGAWTFAVELGASDAANYHAFGDSVAIEGGRALIGALGHASFVGAAYVFERSPSGAWLEVARLEPSDAGGYFGREVALAGDRALIGADAADGIVASSGAAYVFERQANGTWVEVTKLVAGDGAMNDGFGACVALRGDRALIGARGDDDFGDSSGSAYVLERQAGGAWLQVAKLHAGYASPVDLFGCDVALGEDRALVGAFFDDTTEPDAGAAYVFEPQANGVWMQTARIVASNAGSIPYFGFAVELAGDRALVGAPNADVQGFDSGSAYLFELQPSGGWAEVEQFFPSDGSHHDLIGDAVALAGGRALIGAPAQGPVGASYGAAYLFQLECDVASFCTASTTTHGCVPVMSASGTPSASAASGFTLTCSNLEGQQPAMIFYGVSGRQLGTWAPGSTSSLCVRQPIQRTTLASSGGTAGACDGSVSIDLLAYLAAHPTALGQPLAAGEFFECQTWFADPPARKGSNLSDALRFAWCP